VTRHGSVRQSMALMPVKAFSGVRGELDVLGE